MSELMLHQAEPELAGLKTAKFSPSIPYTIPDLGISRFLVQDLVLRHLHVDGITTLEDASRLLKLSTPILENVFRQLRQQQIVQVPGTVGEDYRFSLTATGRAIASQRFDLHRYVGPAPVSMNDYTRATRAQAAKVTIDRSRLRDALSDLATTDSLLDQLGPALISQTSLFLYGPTGNGKTSIAERLLRIYEDTILIPYAVEVDGKIVVVFDPAVHQRVDDDRPGLDPRWVVCKRPLITVGGELVASMLELHYDEASGVFAAPAQMKANNGIFLIDDFGRQIISPRELLNRWIVPLDRRVDYLTLPYGVKFQVPFEVMVVFATNLDPNELADEAFLRRIRNKVLIEPIDAQTFDRIWRRAVTARNMPYHPEDADFVRELCQRDGRTELRACYPVDLCDILQTINLYEKRQPRTSRADLERAVGLYFAR